MHSPTVYKVFFKNGRVTLRLVLVFFSRSFKSAQGFPIPRAITREFTPRVHYMVTFRAGGQRETEISDDR